MKITTAQINALSKADFVAKLGGLFEASPWVAEKVVGKRPVRDREHLFRLMGDAVRRATPDQQLALIRAHPDLVGRAAREGKLSTASASEQAGAGLAALSAADVRWFDRYNRAYREKFDHPLIVCVRDVKGDVKQAILDLFEVRLHNDPDRERRIALDEINKIAQFRLGDLMD